MKKLALLFPGQGSQYVGMGKDLCQRYPIVEKTLDEANEALGFDLKKLCFAGNKKELTKTENTQPALLACSVAAFRALHEEFDLNPTYLAGHSLGEISALACTGAIEFADALYIVRERGLFMTEAAGEGMGAMAAVMGLEPEVVETACARLSAEGDEIVISNYNAPTDLVISGKKHSVDQLGKELADQGAIVVPLKVSAPFHSPYMEAAASKFKLALGKYQFHDFKWPVISNVDAVPYSDPQEIVQRLFQQMVQPVQWIQTIQFLEKAGIEAAIELGGKTVLKKLMPKNSKVIEAFTFSDHDPIEPLVEFLPPSEQRMGIFKLDLMNRCLTSAVCTKNNNFDNLAYEQGVVVPYYQVRAIVEELEKTGAEPTQEQMTAALDMLQSVFKTKQVPKAEQEQWFDEILTESRTKRYFPDFKVS